MNPIPWSVSFAGENIPCNREAILEIDPSLTGILVIAKVTPFGEQRFLMCIALGRGNIRDVALAALRDFTVMVLTPTHFSYMDKPDDLAQLIISMSRELLPIVFLADP